MDIVDIKRFGGGKEGGKKGEGKGIGDGEQYRRVVE